MVDSHQFVFLIHTCKSDAKTVNLWLKRTWSDDFWKREKRFPCTIKLNYTKKFNKRVMRPIRVRRQSTGHLQVTRNSGLWETIDVSFPALKSKTDLKKNGKSLIIITYRTCFLIVSDVPHYLVNHMNHTITSQQIVKQHRCIDIMPIQLEVRNILFAKKVSHQLRDNMRLEQHRSLFTIL